MDKMGLLQLSGADRVGIALVPMNEPQKGLMLQVQDTQHFSNRTDGDLGTSPAPEPACDRARAGSSRDAHLPRHMHPSLT